MSITSNRLAGTRQHKQSAVLRTFDVQSLNLYPSGREDPKRRLYKLSVQVYKSDCASVTDRWI